MFESGWLAVYAYLGILGLLAMYGVHRLFVLWTYWRHRNDAPPAVALDHLPVVTIQLPVFNERYVLERLVDAACSMDWPKDRLEVQILDDSTDDTTVIAQATAARWRRKGVDVHVLRRPDRVGFKAGALAWGMQRARGEFLAVFDADFVPRPDFLKQMMPFFGDASARIGMVQARWAHLNEEAHSLTRAAAMLLDGHFVLEHTARNRSGRYFNFNGTAGIWRRDCIADAGGWQHDTLTEDLDLSYRAQLKGWHFRFLKDVNAPAELPTDMRAFKTQQHRWAKGSIQTARKLLPTIARAPIPWWVKVESFVHLTSNLAYPMVVLLAVLMPAAVAIRGLGTMSEWLFLDLPAFALATCSVAMFYAMAAHEGHDRGNLRRYLRIPFVMAVGIGMSINQTRAVLEGLFDGDVTFVRTPKTGSIGASVGAAQGRYRQLAGLAPVAELTLGLYFVVGIVWAFLQGYWASLPFMLLFATGFVYVGVSSLLPDRGLVVEPAAGTATPAVS